jgi:hypothetical protein
LQSPTPFEPFTRAQRAVIIWAIVFQIDVALCALLVPPIH